MKVWASINSDKIEKASAIEANGSYTYFCVFLLLGFEKDWLGIPGAKVRKEGI